MQFTTLAFLAGASFVAAQTQHLVTVGDGGIKFEPSNLTNVAAGDSIVFEFRGGNHSVTQSTFAEPCSLMTTPQQGVDSDYMFIGDNAAQFMQWSITVDNATAPLWFYCKQGQHCKNGMVFSVNAPADKSHAQFVQNAANSAGAGAGAGAGGATPSGSGAAGGAGGAASPSGGAANPTVSANGGAAAGAGAGDGALSNAASLYVTAFIAAMVTFGVL